MAEKSGISWTHATFNPVRGCVPVSAACDHCYAELLSKRNPAVLGKWGDEADGGTRVVAAEDYWEEPGKWNKQAAAEGVRKRVFCESLGDVFEDWNGPMIDHRGKRLYSNSLVNAGWSNADGLTVESQINYPLTIDGVLHRLFKLIEAMPWLDWLLLTKRPENILRKWPRVGWPDAGVPGTLGRRLRFDNVWLGTTVENQDCADKRIPELLKCRDLVPVLFLSCEPLVGPLNLHPWLCYMGNSDKPEQQYSESICKPSGNIDWLIAGGESGPHARPSHPKWFESLRRQCEEAEVPFHFKQWGEYVPGDHDCVTFGDEMKTILPWHGVDGSDDATPMVRVGVRRAGRLLNGVLHDAFPESKI